VRDAPRSLAEAKQTCAPQESSLTALTEIAEEVITGQAIPVTEWSAFSEPIVMSLRLLFASRAEIAQLGVGPLLESQADRLDGKSGAADRFEAMGALLLSAQARLENAERTSDPDAIRPCLDMFEQAGAASWADRTRRLARTLGVHIAAGRNSGPLSKRESEVVRLLGEGLSNAEIAARLFLSERTVETHLRNSYAKLGLGSLVALATWPYGLKARLRSATDGG
jgi:DNA-binding CsgD family transcriptional regulator